MGIGAFHKTFSHAGSDTLDSIVAYDRAEVESAYMGQVNMSVVSSFCGPEGLIWGYDAARQELEALDLLEGLTPGGITVKDGQGLREASRGLFGTRDERHFPFLPGSHVFCAGKFCSFRGPTHLYSAAAIGIPHERDKAACLLMEDVGQIIGVDGDSLQGGIRHKLVANMAKSVLAVGENHRIEYREIIVDFVSREIRAGDIGCALVSMPYFHIAKHAYDDDLADLTLSAWAERKSEFYLDAYPEPVSPTMG